MNEKESEGGRPTSSVFGWSAPLILIRGVNEKESEGAGMNVFGWSAPCILHGRSRIKFSEKSACLATYMHEHLLFAYIHA